MSTITTPITELFGIKHPILLAGMNVAAGPELAAAVTNAGGLGVIGGLGYTPKILRQQVSHLSFSAGRREPSVNICPLFKRTDRRISLSHCGFWARHRSLTDDLVTLVDSSYQEGLEGS